MLIRPPDWQTTIGISDSIFTSKISPDNTFIRHWNPCWGRACFVVYSLSLFLPISLFLLFFLFFYFLLLDFGLSRLTSLQFIQYYVAGFYMPTIPQSPPSYFQDYSTCNNARLEFSTIFVPSFDPNEWCLKNGSSLTNLPDKTIFLFLSNTQLNLT